MKSTNNSSSLIVLAMIEPNTLPPLSSCAT